MSFKTEVNMQAKETKLQDIIEGTKQYIIPLFQRTYSWMSKVYNFVPVQDFSETWTDEKLYAKYGLTEEEISFIESMIRPMDLTQSGGEDV